LSATYDVRGHETQDPPDKPIAQTQNSIDCRARVWGNSGECEAASQSLQGGVIHMRRRVSAAILIASLMVSTHAAAGQWPVGVEGVVRSGESVRPVFVEIAKLPAMDDSTIARIVQQGRRDEESGPGLPVTPEQFERLQAEQVIPTIDRFAQFTDAGALKDFATLRSSSSQAVFRGATSFACNNSIRWTPGEPTIAVGPGGILQTSNVGVAFFTASGVKTKEVFSRTFFGGAYGGNADGIFDMRSFFDALRRRYVVVGMDLENKVSSSPRSYLYVAISQDSTLNAFNVYRFVNTILYTYGDFPHVGVSDDKLAVTQRYFDSRTGQDYWTDTPIFIFDRAAMYAGAPTTMVQMMAYSAFPFNWFSPNERFGMAPAVNLTSDNDIHLLSNDVLGHHAILALKVSGPPSAPYFSGRLGLAVSPYTPPPPAPQRGSDGTLSITYPLDCRISSQLYMVDGIITAAWSTAAVIQGNTVGAIRMVKYNVHSGQVALDETYGGADRHFLHPSAYSDRLGNTFLGYTVASPSISTTSGLSFRGANESSLSNAGLLWNAPVVPVSGLSSRWGDYTTMAPGDVLGDRSTAWFTGLFQAPGTWNTIISNCVMPLGAIAGRVVEDCDGELATTTDFEGQGGQSVYLYRGKRSGTSATPLFRSTVTDSAGQWSFGSLPAGEYHVSMVREFLAESRPAKIYNKPIPGAGANSQVVASDGFAIDVVLADGQMCESNTFVEGVYLYSVAAADPATASPTMSNRHGCTGDSVVVAVGLNATARAQGFASWRLYDNGVHKGALASYSLREEGSRVISVCPSDRVWTPEPFISGAADAIAMDPQGNVFVVQPDLDCAGDGERGVVYLVNGDKAILPSAPIRMGAIARTTNGELYFKSYDLASYMVYRLEGGTYQLQDIDAFVHAMLPRAQGGIYIAGAGDMYIGGAYKDGQGYGLANGLSGGAVLGLASDASGRVFAAGSFTQAWNLSGPAVGVNGVARYEPLTNMWSSLDFPAGITATCIAVDSRGTVYVSGRVGPNANVYRYDGSAWTNIVTCVGDIKALVCDTDNRLFIGGAFERCGYPSSYMYAIANLAMWDGRFVHAVGKGLQGVLTGLAITPNGELIASGSFSGVGGTSASMVATCNFGIARGTVRQGAAVVVSPSTASVAFGAVAQVSVSVQSAAVASGAVEIYEGNRLLASRIVDEAFFDSVELLLGELPEGPHAIHARFLGNGAILPAVSAAVTITVNPSNAVAGNEHWDERFSGGQLAFTAITASPTGARLAAAMGAPGYEYIPTYPVYGWNGSQWTMLGTGANNRVNAVAFGSGGQVYAAGEFTRIGGVNANGIARWTGAAWVPMGNGVNGVVHAMGVDGAGNLYVAGAFTTADGRSARNIARWNGVRWDSVGRGVPNTVRALAVRPTGVLYAGGDGGGATGCVAFWDGGAWGSLGTSTLDARISVRALAFDASGSLCAGFNGSVAPYTVPTVASWSGTSWTPLQGNTADARGGNVWLEEIRAMATDSNGLLFAAGEPVYPHYSLFNCSFTPCVPGTPRISTVESWNGTTWGQVNGPDVKLEYCSLGYVCSYSTSGHAPANALAVDESGRVLEAGAIRGGIHISGAGAFTGFMRPGAGVEGSVQSLARDESGAILATVSGVVGSTYSTYVAMWDGATWSSMNTFTPALSGTNDNPLLAAGAGRSWLKLDNTTRYSGFGGSSFSVVEGNIYSRNGAVWERKGTLWTNTGAAWDLGGRGPFVVSCMLPVSSGSTYFAGQFTHANGMVVRNIARYSDAAGWSAVGAGLNGVVKAMAVDRVGNVYAGGAFDTAGVMHARGIARWNGSEWQGVGGGLNGEVRAIAIDPLNRVYVAGTFDSAGDVPARHLARWDGAHWTAIGGGGDKYGIARLTFDAFGNLYAAGAFTSIDGTVMDNIGKWDGARWSALGSGANRRILSMVMDSTSSLYIGGEFTLAGGKLASGIARYTGLPAAVADVEGGPSRDGARLAFGLPSPNPSQGLTSMRYSLPRPGVVRLDVYEVTGRRVKTIVATRSTAGPGLLEWDGRDGDGRLMPAGLYLFQASAEGVKTSRRVMLVR
jgi:trimeric autotransporter adhesin